MYKYSRTAQERFFREPIFAYLFLLFASDSDARKFSEAKFAENKDERFAPRMQQELVELKHDSLKHLRESSDQTATTLLSLLKI